MRFSSATSDQESIWQLAGGRVVSLLATIMLAILIWLFVQRVIPSGMISIGGIGLELILCAAFTLALERSLVSLPLSSIWRYRLAFLSTIAIFLVLWLGYWMISFQPIGIIWILAAATGSFLGGILATSFNEKLWENNSPPSMEIMQDVHQKHLEVIGLPGPTPWLKRAFDLILTLVGLVLSLPIWFVSIFLIWIEDPGPLLFVKNSVGKGGWNFHQLKLRTMVRGAEDITGPVLASEADERTLRVGRFLRKTALDELPQLLNILRGEMSFVGPRPQRTVLVREYLDEMPEYAERHRVLPGLSGLAQVAGDYYLTPRQKLRFDRLYIQHANLGYDVKLLFLAFLITFWFRWQKDWDGRLPRNWLRY